MTTEPLIRLSDGTPAQPLYRIVYFTLVNVKTALDPKSVKHVFLTGLRHDQLALAARICAELERQFNVTFARAELQTGEQEGDRYVAADAKPDTD